MHSLCVEKTAKKQNQPTKRTHIKKSLYIQLFSFQNRNYSLFIPQTWLQLAKIILKSWKLANDLWFSTSDPLEGPKYALEKRRKKIL